MKLKFSDDFLKQQTFAFLFFWFLNFFSTLLFFLLYKIFSKYNFNFLFQSFFCQFFFQYKQLSFCFFKHNKRFKFNYVSNCIEIFLKNDGFLFNQYFFFLKTFFFYNYLQDLFGDFFFLSKKQYNVVRALLRNLHNSFQLSVIRFSLFDVFYSISNIFLSAQWLERETRDLFGFYFLFNLDLRRLITDYGFRGYPLSKSFPLTGFYELRRNELTKNLFYRPIKQLNEYIVLNFLKNVVH